jgi:putative NADH-flavin reductase
MRYNKLELKNCLLLEQPSTLTYRSHPKKICKHILGYHEELFWSVIKVAPIFKGCEFFVNICLFGATGRVGSVLLENTLLNNHIVRVLVRNTNNLPNHPNLTVIQGNVLNESDLAEAMAGTEVVLSALNTDKGTVLSDFTPMIIKLMEKQGLRRIITIGTAGILQARSEPHLFRFQSSESKRKSTRDAEEHLKAYMLLKQSQLDWTIVCPTYLPTGERIGQYRYEKDILPENPSSISIFDTGDFAFQQLFSNEFNCCRVGLTY